APARRSPRRQPLGAVTAVFLLLCGCLSLGAAVAAPRLHNSQHMSRVQAQVETELAAAGSADSPQKLKPATASDSPSGLETSAAKPSQSSVVRKNIEPAPVEAVSVTKSRAIGGSPSLARPVATTASVASGPFTVSVAYAAPDLQALAYSATEALT